MKAPAKKKSASRKRANRKNATKSTGPKTKKGKQAVALNGTTHGLRSLKPVLPWLEKEADWEAHRDQIISQLQPANGLEAAFAERIALGIWRLARSVETEPALLDAARERRRWNTIGNLLAVESLSTHKESTKETLARLTTERDRLCAIADLWRAILSKSKRLKPAPEIANEVIAPIWSPEEWREKGDSFDEAFSWPPSKLSELRAMAHWLVENSDAEPTTPVEEFAQMAVSAAQAASELIQRIEEQSAQAADLASVETDVLEKLVRYETSTHRTLLKDLHELQRLQGLRNGQAVAAPLAIDITSDA